MSGVFGSYADVCMDQIRAQVQATIIVGQSLVDDCVTETSSFLDRLTSIGLEPKQELKNST